MPEFALTGLDDNFPATGDDNSGDDTIIAFSGNDTVDAGDGNDAVSGGSGFDLIYGGAGRDCLSDFTIVFGATYEQDSLFGGLGNDVIEMQRKVGGPALQAVGGTIDGGDGKDRLVVEEFSGTGTDISAMTITGMEALRYVGDLTLASSHLAQFDRVEIEGGLVAILRLADNAALALTSKIEVQQIHLADGGQLLDASGASFVGSDILEFLVVAVTTRSSLREIPHACWVTAATTSFPFGGRSTRNRTSSGTVGPIPLSAVGRPTASTAAQVTTN